MIEPCAFMLRRAVTNPDTARGKIKEENLSFEGFLEAICRLSLVKALPTATEIEASGCADAGVCTRTSLNSRLSDLPSHSLALCYVTVLVKLAAGKWDGYNMTHEEFRVARSLSWGEWDASAGELHTRVEQTIMSILRLIEDGSHREDKLVLTKKEAKDWASHHLPQYNRSYMDM
jgi:hypothetical protein